MGYYPCIMTTLTRSTERAGRQCQVGSLTGAVASQKVTEAPKGSLRMVGNHSESVKAQASLTARQTGRAGTKVGLSDPVVPHGRAIAQRIKGSLSQFASQYDLRQQYAGIFLSDYVPVK